MSRILVFLLALTLSLSAIGQTKYPIHVDSSLADGDQVGVSFVFELKEAIRGSQSFRLIEDSKQRPYIRLALVSLATSTLGTAIGTTYAYDSDSMWLLGAYLTSGVQTCGRDKVQTCARSTLGAIDKALGDLQKHAPELWRTLK